MVELIRKFEEIDEAPRMVIWVAGWLLLTPFMFVWWIIWLMYKDEAKAKIKANKHVNKTSFTVEQDKERDIEEQMRFEIRQKLMRERIEKEER